MGFRSQPGIREINTVQKIKTGTFGRKVEQSTEILNVGILRNVNQACGNLAAAEANQERRPAED